MFEVSHRLIGIYKVANATKSESLTPKRAPQFQRSVSQVFQSTTLR